MKVVRNLLVAPCLLLAGASAAADRPHDEFFWIGEINKASAIVLVEKGIVQKSLGASIARTLTQVLADGDRPGAARPTDYLQVERALISVAGPEVTRLHSGRSRQDIRATMERLAMRDELIAAFEALNKSRRALLSLASRHPNAIIPSYTLGVQAQPLSFGHYILAYCEALGRTADRMREAYARLNLSPLGSAAHGTSSFPIDRPRLAELLGFDGVVENSFAANQLSPIDVGSELVGLAASGALIVGTLAADITAQYAQTRPWLVFAEGAQTGTSSIMPQKRNPTGLVFLRTQASTLIGHAQTFQLVAHNLSAGMSDYKPFTSPKQGGQPINVMREMRDLFGDLADLTDTLTLDEKRALEEVNAGYSTTTELADTLQRESNVPFRVGHHFASELVNYGRSHGLRPSEIPFEEARSIFASAAKSLRQDQTQLLLTEQEFRKSLTPENMVATAKPMGGPQPAEVARMLANETSRLASDQKWIQTVRVRLDEASRRLDQSLADIREP
jgi:argininosuccinate lyase